MDDQGLIGRKIKKCPECTGDLIVRRNRQNGSLFLGCTEWPECQRTEGLPKYYRIQLAGPPVVPVLQGLADAAPEVAPVDMGVSQPQVQKNRASEQQLASRPAVD